MRAEDTLSFGYSKEERLRMLDQMTSLSNAFYIGATRVGCHAYIEFCGLMNEYIKLCQEAEEEDIDWTNANTHSGKVLPVRPHHIQYLAEKLDCIFGPALKHPRNRRLFMQSLFPMEEEESIL